MKNSTYIESIKIYAGMMNEEDDVIYYLSYYIECHLTQYFMEKYKIENSDRVIKKEFSEWSDIKKSRCEYSSYMLPDERIVPVVFCRHVISKNVHVFWSIDHSSNPLFNEKS